MGFRQRSFGLADVKVSADPGAQAFVGQIQYLLLLGRGGGRDVAVGVLQRQLNVCAHHIVLQFELGQARFGGAHVRQVDGAFGAVAFPAPQVEGVAQAQRRIVVPRVGAAQFAGAVELILGPVVALEGSVAVDLQRLGRLCHPGQRPGLAHAGGGHGQAGAVMGGEFNPTVELRVAVGLPPLGGGPVGVAGGALDRGVGGQGVGVDRLALGAIPPVPMQPLMTDVKAQTLRVFSSLLMRRGTASEFLRGCCARGGAILGGGREDDKLAFL